jgi:hypothetical protein
MYQPMNVELATRLGMSAALCAQSLWDGISGAFNAEVQRAKGSLWIRMGNRQLSVLVPYLTPHMTRRALKKLVACGIVHTCDLNENPFDHTYWYSFTGYGTCLMKVTTDDEGEWADE